MALVHAQEIALESNVVLTVVDQIVVHVAEQHVPRYKRVNLSDWNPTEDVRQGQVVLVRFKDFLVATQRVLQVVAKALVLLVVFLLEKGVAGFPILVDVYQYITQRTVGMASVRLNGKIQQRVLEIVQLKRQQDQVLRHKQQGQQQGQ